jgi:hypothetical protein
MQRVFLSYTYTSHPGYSAEIDMLQRTTRRVVEAMGLTVVDGQDLGGRALDSEIERRLAASDATIALFTPQADAAGEPVPPEFVSTEFQRARALGKPTLRILHTQLTLRGLGAGEEYVLFEPDKMLDVVLKLLQTLALWKRENGRPVQIQVQPDHLAERFGNNRADRCEYELFLDGRGEPQAPREARLWPEPGAAYVYIPNFIDGAKIRIRLTVNGENWNSRFILPQMGGVALVKEGA